MEQSHDADALTALLAGRETELLDRWLESQTEAHGGHAQLLPEHELRDQSARFLAALRGALVDAPHGTYDDPAYDGVRDVLQEVSRRRAAVGMTPTQTATFVFSLKRPLFEIAAADGPVDRELWATTLLLDELGLYTTEIAMDVREEVIGRQEQELLELSTPVVKLWEGILALPLIGTLDSARAQTVTENLLERIAQTTSQIAIIDITGVPTVDTLVAQHLLKTVAAARLMGADCIISGIRPQIAQTMVQLGLSMQDVATQATMADAIGLAFKRLGLTVVPAPPNPAR